MIKTFSRSLHILKPVHKFPRGCSLSNCAVQSGSKTREKQKHPLIKDPFIEDYVYDLIEIFEKNKINTILIGPISTPDYNFASIESRLLFFKKTRDFRNFKETKTEFENIVKEIKNTDYETKKQWFIKLKNNMMIYSDKNKWVNQLLDIYNS